MRTLIAPRNPVGSSPDDDQTGVRALLSALPEPDPMPAFLVERISASLAAEQVQRADVSSGASVTPFLATPRRRPGRLLFAIAGAAAVVLIGVVGTNLLRANQTTVASNSAASAITSGARESGRAASPSAGEKAFVGGGLSPASIQIRLSDVRYTQAGFLVQARTLRDATFAPVQSIAAASPGVGPIGTSAGLTDCLAAIGAGRAQMVQADLAFYQGRPAVIIVATTEGVSTAYAVGRECSRADPALLRQGTTLP
ncbi:MAG: hypothetical protein ACYCV4_12930 [Dermatophilaceae bacterium]